MHEMPGMKQADDLPAGLRSYASGPFFNCPELACEAFGPVAYEPCLTHMAYLYRRFGPPLWGSDPYKEIASYILTTARDGLWLECRCKAGQLRLGFGVAYSPQLAAGFPDRHRFDAENDLVRQCRVDLVNALRELLRPVEVRDISINLLGQCDEDPGNTAKPSRYAGFGCDRDALELLLADEKGDQ